MFHQLYPSAKAGPAMTVPWFPVAWVPRRVPEVVGVDLTLSGPEDTWTLSFNENLVDGGGGGGGGGGVAPAEL